MSTTRFNFTTAEPSIDTADDDTDTTSEYVDGKVRTQLSSALIDHVQQLGLSRNKASGGTHEKRDASRTQQQVHTDGLKGEAGLHHAYNEWELDEEIYEGHGDGGIDGYLWLDGELRSVDVKTASTAPPWIKVEAGAVEGKSEESRCDAYVAAHVDGNTVTYYGWLPAEEVIQESNKRTSYAPNRDHKNYVREDGFRPMPPLTVATKTTDSDGFTLVEACNTPQAGD